jgi:uncharacterized protein (TIGR00255 family)
MEVILPVQSMTGYGKRQQSSDGREISVEIKTVNHRFLDISCKLPRCLGFMENEIRGQISKRLKRGHADVYIQYKNSREDAREVTFDLAFAGALGKTFTALKQAVNISGKVHLSDYTAFPDLVCVSEREEDRESVTALAVAVLNLAMDDVLVMRNMEGESLKKDLTLHLELLDSLTGRIAAKAPDVTAAFREKLNARLDEAAISIMDPQRLAQEIALFADRAAIDEELARLASHISQMRCALGENGEMGRRLDFLIQEMNREINTIGAKAQDLDIVRCVVDAKGEIEKLREQVQNVE